MHLLSCLGLEKNGISENTVLVQDFLWVGDLLLRCNKTDQVNFVKKFTLVADEIVDHQM